MFLENYVHVWSGDSFCVLINTILSQCLVSLQETHTHRHTSDIKRQHNRIYPSLSDWERVSLAGRSELVQWHHWVYECECDFCISSCKTSLIIIFNGWMEASFFFFFFLNLTGCSCRSMLLKLLQRSDTSRSQQTGQQSLFNSAFNVYGNLIWMLNWFQSCRYFLLFCFLAVGQ